MKTTQDPLSRKLSRNRRWWRTARIIAASGWTLCLLIALLLLCFHIDRRWPLSSSAREAWRLALGITGTATLLAFLVLILARRLPNSFLAAEVERRYPVLRERLLTAIDLAPVLAAPSDSTSAFSRPLAASLTEETQQATRDLNFLRAVNVRPLYHAAIATAVAMGLVGVERAASPDAFSVWVERMLHPRADIAPFAQTRLWIQPDANLLPQGAGVSISILTKGLPADICRLRYHLQGTPPNQWQTVELKNPQEEKGRREEGKPEDKRQETGDGKDDAPTLQKASFETEKHDGRVFRYRFPSLMQTVSLVAEANDGKSNERSITVEPRPMLLNLRMSVRYPAYMKRADKTLAETSGAIAEPVGSEISVSAVANKPLRSAAFLRDNIGRGTWPVKGESATGHLSVYSSGSYGFRLTDRHGFDSASAPAYPITALKDATPTVQIQKPAVDLDLVPDGSVPLVAHAQDDYGVARMALAYETQIDPEKDRKGGIAAKGALSLPGVTGNPQADARVRWNVGSIRAQVGQIVRYEVAATDNDNVSGPHTGRSTAYRIHVVSMAEMQNRMKSALDEEQRALQSLRQRQIQAQQQLQQARQKRDNAMLSRAQENQRALAQETKSLTERVQSTSAQLENNNLATPSELQKRDQAAQELERSANSKMPQAADAMQQAQNGKNAARSSEMAQAEKAQAEARQALEKAQNLLSRTLPVEQIAQEAARLAQEQKRLANSARSLAEDMQAQQQQTGSKALSPEQKASLEMERRQQAQANADTKRLLSQMEQAAKSAAERGQKSAAEQLKRAAQALKQGQATGQQQKAQSALQKNNPEAASGSQDKAADALEKAAEAAQRAANPEAQSPQAVADRLEQAAQQLSQLAQKQQQLANEAKRNPGAAQSQAQQQRELQKQAQAMQSQTQGAQSAQQSLQNAQQSQSQASQSLSQNQSKSGQQSAQQAAQQLAQAAQQAQQAAQQIRQQQAAQEMQERVERLAQIQRGLQSATQRLDAQQKSGKMDDNAQMEMQQTGERQQKLQEEARNLAKRFPSPAFQSAMNKAAQQMQPATENLSQRDANTGAQTQAAQSRAAQTLETIASALKQQSGGKQGDQQQGQQGQQQQQSGVSASQAQQQAAMGDLTLAQGLQNQVNNATRSLNQARQRNPNGQLDADQQTQNQETTDMQRMARDIARRAAQELGAQPGTPMGDTLDQAGQHMPSSGSATRPAANRRDDATASAAGPDETGAGGTAVAATTAATATAATISGHERAGSAAAKFATRQPSRQKQRLPSDEHPERRAVHKRRQSRNFADLSPRAQRTLRESQNEKVPAEYQELVKRYYRSLAEKKR